MSRSAARHAPGTYRRLYDLQLTDVTADSASDPPRDDVTVGAPAGAS